jgi:hypothetical protein
LVQNIELDQNPFDAGCEIDENVMTKNEFETDPD